MTKPRIAMLKAMTCHPEPRTIEAIHADLQGDCDLVTVYRSLASMVEIGLVRRIFGHSGVALYQLELAPERYHVLTPAEAVDVLEEVLPSPEMRLAVQAVEDSLRAAGFTKVTHLIQFFATKPDQATPARTGSSGEFITGL